MVPKTDILADSINSNNERITTFACTYPRFIHSEVMTHRTFARNASSSRAIPYKVARRKVLDEPVLPSYWGKNQAGMQAAETLGEEDTAYCSEQWRFAAEEAVARADNLASRGLHKQSVNRLLEPFSTITIIITATDFDNFFALRAHADAQPEFRDLAFKMLEAYNASEPVSLEQGEWHIPFFEHMPETASFEQRLKIATARCARVSYLNFDGVIDPEKDYDLHDGLRKSGHWSAFEHCARCEPGERHGPFKGFKQYRKMFLDENRTDPRVVRKTYKPKCAL